jgi:hypothetical protein
LCMKFNIEANGSSFRAVLGPGTRHVQLRSSAERCAWPEATATRRLMTKGKVRDVRYRTESGDQE